MWLRLDTASSKPERDVASLCRHPDSPEKAPTQTYYLCVDANAEAADCVAAIHRDGRAPRGGKRKRAGGIRASIERNRTRLQCYLSCLYMYVWLRRVRRVFRGQPALELLGAARRLVDGANRQAHPWRGAATRGWRT